MIENIKPNEQSELPPVGEVLPVTPEKITSQAPAIPPMNAEIILVTSDVTPGIPGEQVVSEVSTGATVLTPGTATEKPKSDSEEKPADDETLVEPSADDTVSEEPVPGKDDIDPKILEAKAAEDKKALEDAGREAYDEAQKKNLSRMSGGPTPPPTRVISGPKAAEQDPNQDPGKTPKKKDPIIKSILNHKWIVGGLLSLIGVVAIAGTVCSLRQGRDGIAVEPISTPTPSAAAGTPIPEAVPTQIPAEPTATVVVPTSTASAAAGTPEPEPSVVVGEPIMSNVVRVEGVVNFVVSQATSVPVEPVIIPTATARLTETAVPTATAVVPTETPRPTATATPTETPRPTATPETIARSCPSADQLGPWEPSSRGKPVEFEIDATDYGTTVIATIWIPGVTDRGTEYLIRIRDMKLLILGAGTAWKYGSRCSQEEIDRQVADHIARKGEDRVDTIRMSPQQFIYKFRNNMEVLRK